VTKVNWTKKDQCCICISTFLY